MKRLAWLTDVHLNFLAPPDVASFMRSIAEVPADGIVISGDIAEATDAAGHLKEFAQLGPPVYYVLGNHDFYYGTVADVRARMQSLSAQNPGLHYLSQEGVIALTDETCLIGHDGWGDGRYGDYWGLRVHLADWELIGEFTHLGDASRLRLLHQLGDESAAHLRSLLPDALERFQHVVVLTHVPPFMEACWYQGRISDKDWLPHFTCQAVGAVLLEAMQANPGKRMTVLCGHTHGAGEAQLLPNLHVSTGGAEYYHPRLQRVVAVD